MYRDYKDSVLYSPKKNNYIFGSPRLRKALVYKIASACYFVVGLWVWLRRGQPTCDHEPSEEHRVNIGHVYHEENPIISQVYADEETNSTHAAFPPYSHYSELVEKAATQPDILHITFEDAVSDMTLEGWEDDWISYATYNFDKWGKFQEPKIDFVYTWVNGSDEKFQSTKLPYTLNSTLKERIQTSSGKNRYRDWDELRYSIRSVEKFATFRNNIQILVNDVADPQTGEVYKQTPSWLSQKSRVKKVVQVLSQSDFFEEDKKGCLPSFNSLTIENQLHNTPSEVDRVFALSDDMMLGKTHSASDFFSPLFGPALAFKTNSYNTRVKPTDADAQRFGEKPWLIYTSWLLNRRFGERKRKGQAHFGHSLSRKLLREAFHSFPRPELQSACSRFRGDIQSDVSGFQIYSWYLAFHYTMERHREALLWSYIVYRADKNQDGYLSWDEREQVIKDLAEGMQNLDKSTYRTRLFYHAPSILEAAGLESPQVNTNILWTSMDGPAMVKDVECLAFDINECLAHGFSVPPSGDRSEDRNHVFSTSVIFDRLARQDPTCGDCFTKMLLHRKPRGLEPMLPDPVSQPENRATMVKALMKYQYNIVDVDGLFVMVTDAEQVESTLINRFAKRSDRVGQLCLNDDVATDNEQELDDMKRTMKTLFETLLPQRTPYEKRWS